MPNPGSSGEIELRSAAFNDHTPIPSRYSYDGGNVSPPLEWRGMPDGTEELVLLCEDPDAPRGTFTHWVVTHIAPNASGVAGGSRGLPGGATRGRNGFGGLGWGGPARDHRSATSRIATSFTFMLPTRRWASARPPPAEEVHAALNGQILARGTLVGLFGR